MRRVFKWRAFVPMGTVCSVQSAAKIAARLVGGDALGTRQTTGALLREVVAKRDAGIDYWKLARLWRDGRYLVHGVHLTFAFIRSVAVPFIPLSSPQRPKVDRPE